MILKSVGTKDANMLVGSWNKILKTRSFPGNLRHMATSWTLQLPWGRQCPQWFAIFSFDISKPRLGSSPKTTTRNIPVENKAIKLISE